MGQDDFDFTVSKPPTSVGTGSVIYTVTTYLTAYKATSELSFSVELEFTCPSAPQFLIAAPLNGLVYSYDLSIGGPISFDAS